MVDIADLRHFGVYADLLGIGPFLLDSAKRRWIFDTPVVHSPQDALRQMPYGRSVYIHIDYFAVAAAPSQGRLLIFLDGKVANLV